MRVDLEYWANEWEKQQNSLIEKREERFETLFNITEEIYGKKINALDLGCGPGSLEKRFLDRFPDSHITSIDYDPVTLEIAKNMNSSTMTTFLERDLRNEDWDSGMKHEAYDVVYSTTALHWLPEPALRNVYVETAHLLKRGGSLMNGDHMRPEKRSAKFQGLYSVIEENILKTNSNYKNAMGWDQWWNEFKSTGWRPGLFEERERRLETGNHDQKVPLEKHIQFLEEAGFSDIDIPWKYLDNIILLAMK